MMFVLVSSFEKYIYNEISGYTNKDYINIYLNIFCYIEIHCVQLKVSGKSYY